MNGTDRPALKQDGARSGLLPERTEKRFLKSLAGYQEKVTVAAAVSAERNMDVTVKHPGSVRRVK